MKGLKLFFSVCLGILAFHGAYADDADDIARAATRRTAATTVASNRQQSPQVSQRSVAPTTVSRATSIPTTSSSDSNTTERTTSARSGNVVARDTATRTTTTQSVSPRSATNVMPRASTTSSGIVSSPVRSAVDSVSRAATSGTSRTSISRTPAAGTSTSRTATVSRAATIDRTTSPTTTASRAATSRSATTSAVNASRAAVTADDIMSRDYTKCREVYYSCMDEFCANKDSQLKRCACSSRIAEFDELKQQLNEVEDKLLDFNQRLLTVNMDKEDAEALFTATEGELAFQQNDTSDSKQLLDKISEKLNATFSDSTLGSNLAPISLSLNVDAAFDTVDSMMGASTTSLSGTELYSAALPVCREMSLEVCTQDELDIIESQYQMAIEQDCNTVAKAYQTQQNQAREKIREGSALLDMSRLDIYQKRNSDDILTCKKKMLTMLTDTTVCGTNLQKCLDISGHYIDPSTGEAILTADLVNLGNLIVRPTGDQKWTDAAENQKFVSYLNSKKQYLESATENCQDIAGYVWDSFIEDALAQIKLAQESKLEEVRQSCTTLTTQCLTTTAESLEDFDARALSIFGVEADKTVKQMCTEVQNACTALLDTVDGGEEWGSGITDIATDKTYETIIKTCREVGRNCIIQSCKSVSGNFGLCEDINTSVNRKSIINRTACWNEVRNCVAAAGDDALAKVADSLIADNLMSADDMSFYNLLYGGTIEITNGDSEAPTGETNTYVYDLCETECAKTGENFATPENCRICRLTEKLWGNCEADPEALLESDGAHNKLKVVSDTENETLLSWFAKNTNTDDDSDSCRDTSCGPGMINYNGGCIPANSFMGDGLYCPTNTFWNFSVSADSGTNCCRQLDSNDPGERDAMGHCCLSGVVNSITNMNWGTTTEYFLTKDDNKKLGNINPSSGLPPANGATGTIGGLCLPSNAKFVAAYKEGEDMIFLLCLGDLSYTNPTSKFPNGQTISCSGEYIKVNKTQRRYLPANNKETTSQTIYYNARNPNDRNNPYKCIRNGISGDTWGIVPSDENADCAVSNPTTWIIKHN